MMNGNAPNITQPDVAVVHVGINDILAGNSCYDTQILGNITALK